MNVECVKQRVLKGGHDIRRRHKGSLENLKPQTTAKAVLALVP
ncbi:hypothetical protein EV129_13710 [Rhizobium azibense]|uniref:Uncharacterized protein n=1 Tax=Rhizobium azibense TaxID=1136135 RepID=A0A4R3QWW3_9HYPH|nr:hypothetical protein EV129_13710 [Rhizobium azibense]